MADGNIDADAFRKAVISCTACPRLVAWREEVAAVKTKRFAGEEYWGQPVPSFGRHEAELMIVGLAPAAHGANRTGRMFTGDRSGEWLYQALHAYGFANKAASERPGDGLELVNTRITAVAHCAPPQNKLTAEEIKSCNGFLRQEIALCARVRVYIALGGVAFRELTRILGPGQPGGSAPFAHGAVLGLEGGRKLIASYHPSQQNTFTGRLTREMFHKIFRIASRELRKNS